MTIERGKYEFPISWDDSIRAEALREQLMLCGLECSSDAGIPWLWERVPIILVPMDEGIGFVAIKDFRQGVSQEEREWFATRLNTLQSDAYFYPNGNQLVAEGAIQSQGLPATPHLISHISRFERACLLAQGPLIEALLEDTPPLIT